MKIGPSSYLQHLDVLGGDVEGHPNADEGHADEEEAWDDEVGRQHRLPGRQALLREGCVVWPIGCLLALHVVASKMLLQKNSGKRRCS